MINTIKVLAVLTAGCMVSSCASQPTLDLSASSPLGAGDLHSTRAIVSAHQWNFGALNEQVAHASDQQLAGQVSSGIDDDFAQVLVSCQPVFSGYEQQSQNLKWVSFSIAMVGTIAGAVVVPALSAATTVDKVAIAAVGGLSGAANSAQNVLNSEGLNSTETLTIRNNIQQQFSSALNEYYQVRPTNDYDKEITALEKARAACVAYAIQTGVPVTGTSGGH